MSPLRTLQTIMLGLFLIAPAVHAKAAEDVEASSTTNPAPSEAFSNFGRIEVGKITMGAPWAGQKPNEAALVNLQANLDERIGPWLAEVNAAPEAGARVLRIEPYVGGIRYISGGKRVFAGAFAGKSRVLLKLRIVDAASGQVIAEPEFYQHAAGMAGAYSFGGADKAMLARVTTLAVDYLRANHAAAVGGPTGAE